MEACWKGSKQELVWNQIFLFNTCNLVTQNVINISRSACSMYPSWCHDGDFGILLDLVGLCQGHQAGFLSGVFPG